ncbi:flagellar biosynthesis anti-sigma factor FlgM [Simiduia sp. 21SJ11W-1]|uniref:flagellar biosynthesis anti-sigma factor FlgM n=1 Tax=Simiduia sp. 21SJ11W-1 TaxID=2909669 RepID=UPI0020A184CD|nr:flagellar biosynthesis anti-sigma factor FlgM [Simiduia sp. 21SJ11W-1]UTA49455.1 flagellar biosynthesis anti-sigma factor FlgM [Simiduia sp. 21SJ11W-1]
MVIDPKTGLNNLNTQQSQRALQKQSAERSNQPPAEAEAPARDNVQLSTEAQRLQKLEENIAQAPEVNEERVAQLKAAIADGSYSVNADRLADKILSSEGF